MSSEEAVSADATVAVEVVAPALAPDRALDDAHATAVALTATSNGSIVRTPRAVDDFDMIGCSPTALLRIGF
jgi:hypothetical protein